MFRGGGSSAVVDPNAGFFAAQASAVQSGNALAATQDQLQASTNAQNDQAAVQQQAIAAAVGIQQIKSQQEQNQTQIAADATVHLHDLDTANALAISTLAAQADVAKTQLTTDAVKQGQTFSFLDDLARITAPANMPAGFAGGTINGNVNGVHVDFTQQGLLLPAPPVPSTSAADAYNLGITTERNLAVGYLAGQGPSNPDAQIRANQISQFLPAPTFAEASGHPG